VLRVGQELRIPVRSSVAPGREPYVVQRGDTLSSLSRSWNCSVADIRRANGLTGDELLVGQRLAMPTQAVVPLPAQAAGGETYAVRRGDTLSSIATSCGTSVRELCNLNGIAEPNRIREGQVLRLPAGKSAKAPPQRREVAKVTPPPLATPKTLPSDDDLLGLFDEADLFSNYN
jgi:LysM repeat protein